MNATFLLMTIVPLIAFAVADAMGGLKTGVVVAVALSLVLFAANWMMLGFFEPTSLIEPVFFLVLGLASLRLKNSLWFKFQPVVVNGLTAALLAGYQIAGQPLLVKYAPMMDKLMPPENQGVLTDPRILEKLAHVSHALIYMLIIHAVWVAWVALKKSNWAWVGVRLAGYPLLILTVVIAMVAG
ncbi:MAG: Intracellular septation protein [Pseudomonadota bacterium]|jgi:intracellular septation protein A